MKHILSLPPKATAVSSEFSGHHSLLTAEEVFSGSQLDGSILLPASQTVLSPQTHQVLLGGDARGTHRSDPGPEAPLRMPIIQ